MAVASNPLTEKYDLCVGDVVMKKILCFVALFTLGQAAYALPILSGSIAGPLDSSTINMQFENDSTAGESILSLILDGNPATPPIIWDSLGFLSGQSAEFLGIGTRVVTLDFLSSFDAGENFLLSGMDPDGDPVPAGIPVSGLLNVAVTAVFSDQSAVRYQFASDPTDGGLRLVVSTPDTPVPAPATLLLLGLSLAGLGLARRRK